MLKHVPGRMLVAAHRGVSGANIPCNTKAAFGIALAQGADILELDVAQSADGELFVFHPGMEKPHLNLDVSLSKLTAAEIRKLRFVNMDNVPTSYEIATLEDMFAFLKGKAYINVDKYWTDVEKITHAIRRAGVEDQVIVKAPSKAAHAKTYIDEVARYASDLPFMCVIETKDEISEYIEEKGINYIGVEAIFASEQDEVATDAYIQKQHERGRMMFGNAIVYDEKRIISAGHTDDLALTTDPDAGWGWFADKKFDIIQTDWCSMLKDYLNTRKK